jgi:hypothetical protein
VGAAPAPGIGFVATAGLGLSAYSVNLEARADLPASVTRSDGSGVRSSLVLGSFVPCRHFEIVALCAVLSAGALHGEGLNVGLPDRTTTFYGAGGLRSGVEIPVARHFHLGIHGDASRGRRFETSDLLCGRRRLSPGCSRLASSVSFDDGIGRLGGSTGGGHGGSVRLRCRLRA